MNYTESTYRMPTTNLADIHKAVYQQLVPRGAQRDFAFSVLGVIGEQALVMVRQRDDQGTQSPQTGERLDISLTCQVSFSSGWKHITPAPEDTESRMRWLEKRAESNGFRLLDVVEVEHTTVPVKDRKRNVRIPATQFVGKIEITDAQAFAGALIKGIGRARTWGFGTINIFEREVVEQ